MELNICIWRFYIISSSVIILSSSDNSIIEDSTFRLAVTFLVLFEKLVTAPSIDWRSLVKGVEIARVLRDFIDFLEMTSTDCLDKGEGLNTEEVFLILET